MRFKNNFFSNPFRYPQIALWICVSFTVSNADASRVRGDIDYQYFRDFAENKGAFTIGATNISIFDKNGNDVGIMMKNIPMPDLKTASRIGAYANLIAPSFLTSVQHNVGYGSVQFGGEDSNPDSHHFSYLLTNRNEFPKEWEGKTYKEPQETDYHIPRLHKMVTEVAPAELIDFLTEDDAENTRILTDLTRFPVYVRVGSGDQEVNDTSADDDKARLLSDAYKYTIGGVTHTMSIANTSTITANGTITPEGKRITDKPLTLFGSVYGPMITYGRSGDSGSALLGYDAEKKKWLIVGVMKSDYGYGNIWSLTRLSFVKSIQTQANAGTIENKNANQIWEWSVDPNMPENSHIQLATGPSLLVNLKNEKLANLDTNKIRPSMDYGKTVYFNGKDGGVLVLKDNINQGAGALYFDVDFTVKPESNQTWLGAGISVAKDKTVNWQIANPEGDRLSKLGEGTLLVQGKGQNLGDISVGDGIVILDQQADEKGQKQAFNQVGIVSGRPTVILKSADQIDPNKLYFGFRGGRLDLNGNSLSFYRIQNTDEGATIVNHNLSETANIELGKFPESSLSFSDNELNEADIYVYHNALFNSVDYYIAKTSLDERKKDTKDYYFPLFQEDNKYWMYIGEDKQEAINKVINQKEFSFAYSGYFGEKQNTQANGRLNISYRPDSSKSTFLFTGGMNINGELSIEKGELILSGVPTPHARDVLNNREVIYEDDWINRAYQAKNINVKSNAILTVGRNVSSLNANIQAQNDSVLNLGYQSGQKVCIRSDYTGDVGCDTPSYETKTFNTIPRMQLTGSILAGENSYINLGKTDFQGTIKGSNTSNANLSKEAHWLLTGDSSLGSLNFEEGAEITLSQDGSKFNTLTLETMSGKGKFYYRTNFSALAGDKVVVKGKASGEHVIFIDDIGTEPKRSKERLALMQVTDSSNDLSITLHNHYADIGAYRYRLIAEGDYFRLYNPIVEKEIEQERLAAEELARQEAEAKRLEEERKIKENQERYKAELGNLKQADLISRVSNSALSELSGQVNMVLQNDLRLNSHFLQDTPSQVKVWTNIDVKKGRYQSDYYRPYQQNSHYVELGSESAVNDKGISIGAILSQSRSNETYDNASGKRIFSQGTFYTRIFSDKGIFVIADLSYGNSNTQVSLDKQRVDLKRKIFSSGMLLGKKWILSDIDLKTMIGVRYHHFNAINYELNNAQISSPSFNVFNYYAGLSLSKTWLWNGFMITPNVSVHYFDASQDTLDDAIKVNNIPLRQQFMRGWQYQSGLNIGVGAWTTGITFAYEQGNEVSHSQRFGLNIEYRF